MEDIHATVSKISPPRSDMISSFLLKAPKSAFVLLTPLNSVESASRTEGRGNVYFKEMRTGQPYR